MVNLIQQCLAELSAFINPLMSASASGNLAMLLSEMELVARNDDVDSVASTISELVEVLDTARAWSSAPPSSPSEVLAFVGHVRLGFARLRVAFDRLTLTSEPALTERGATLVDAFFGRLVYIWLRRRFPLASAVLEAAGCIARPTYAAEANRIALSWVDRRAIQSLLRDPRAHLASAYAHSGWQSEPDVADALRQVARALQPLAETLGCQLIPPAPDAAEADRSLIVLRDLPGSEDVRAQIGVLMTPVFDAGKTSIESWGFSPLGLVNFDEVLGRWRVALETAVNFTSIVVGHGEVLTDSDADAFSGKLQLAMTGSDPALLIGSATGSHLVVGRVATSLAIEARATGAPSWSIEISIDFTSCELVVRPADPNGFLASLVGSGVTVPAFDLGFGWSSMAGFAVRGSGSASIDIPVNRRIGPLLVSSLGLAAGTSSTGATLSGRVSAALSLGPIVASVKGLGLGVQASIPAEGAGAFGLFDLGDPFPLWPTGVGLAIDADGLTGGGFVEYDDTDKSYSGILALSYGELALTAIGLIATEMPDGSKGFALLGILGVEFDPAIQLSFGFTLSAVGGLLAVNRTMDVDALRIGLKQQTLGSVLFPEDPIANAPRIISDLKSVFPIHEGRYVVGPMVQIGWGTPSLIVAEVGIFLEVPAPIRMVLLGQITAGLPKPDDAIVELHVDVLGVINFAKKSLAIDATLHDSRILTYSLSGDAALRFLWGDSPSLCMALGGVHPKFSPPPEFPELRRLTLDLSSSRKLQLSCKVYQALTSNTVQFGARLDAHAEGAGATLDGDLAFDALLYLNPFHFTVDMGGSMTARYHGHKVAGVRLSLTLSGPTPWRAKGKAAFEILKWDVEVSFDKSWGRTDAGRLDARDAWRELESELGRTENWSIALPRSTVVESLRDVQAEKDTLIVHPAGSVEFCQRVLPLEIELDNLGNAPITGANYFRIAALEVHATPSNVFSLDVLPLREQFSRSQYVDVSAAERLSLPSFEKLIAGVSGGTTALRVIGNAIPTPLVYESIVLDGPSAPSKRDGSALWSIAKHRMARSAAARSRRSSPRIAAYLPLRSHAAAVKVADTAYQIVDASTLEPVAGESPGGTTQLEAKQRRVDPTHLVVELGDAVATPHSGGSGTPQSSNQDDVDALAHYYFTPALRRGLACAIGSLGRRETGRARITTRMTVEAQGGEGGGTCDRDIDLFGPSDVLGFDPRAVARTDPRRDVGDFEPGLFAAIELVAPDLPWRFTPKPPEGGTLTPWIALVVLNENEFTPGDSSATPSSIVVLSVASLPDLASIARWAHVQLTAHDALVDGPNVSTQQITTLVAQAVLAADEEAPECAVSRLVCARRLEAGTRYHAFVVPTFKLGRVAAGCAEANGTDPVDTFAWPIEDETTVRLPVYYHWSFGTGPRGGFEELVRLLEPRVLARLGVRAMDCSEPGYGLPAPSTVLELEGALRSLDTELADWGFARQASSVPATPDAFQVELANQVLDKPINDRALVTVAIGSLGTSAVADVSVIMVPAPLAPDIAPTFRLDVRFRLGPGLTAHVEAGVTTSYELLASAVVFDDDVFKATVVDCPPQQTLHFRITSLTSSGAVVGRTSNLTVTTPVYPIPTLVPPIYGARYRGRTAVTPPTAATTWFEEVNLDPRNRAAAGFGALVIEQQQEALIAACWDQLGQVDEANEALRRGQLGREVATRALAQLAHLALGDFLRVTAPVHARIAIRVDGERTTVANAIAKSRIPTAVLDRSFRRLQRRRGSVRRRQRIADSPAYADMLERLNGEGADALSPLAPLAPPAGLVTLCSVTRSLARAENVTFDGDSSSPPTTPTLPTNDPGPLGSGGLPGPSTSPLPASKVRPLCEEFVTCGLVKQEFASSTSRGRVTELRDVVCFALETFLASKPEPADPRMPLILSDVRNAIESALDPTVTIPARVFSRVHLSQSAVEQRTAAAVDALAPLTISPEFPQPMYEPLREISQDLILPGVETVPRNTLGLLETNGRFVESYMLALNDCFGAEARWRGAPVDLRATFFRQFWDVDDAITSDDPVIRESLADIRRVREWADRRLGANDNRPAEALVLLVKGDLLAKYPHTIVYAIAARGPANAFVPGLAEYHDRFEAGEQEAAHIFPLFSGSMAPDLWFFGFPFDAEQARGGSIDFPKGVFFVLEERVAEARFGLDEGTGAPATQDLASWDDLTWDHFGSTASHGVYTQPLSSGAYLNSIAPLPVDESAVDVAWTDSAAVIAHATLQKPVRMAVHATRMINRQYG